MRASDLNIEYTDVTPVWLSPSDARAAFEQKAVDAWIIWDPFLAVVQATGNARIRSEHRIHRCDACVALAIRRPRGVRTKGGRRLDHMGSLSRGRAGDGECAHQI